MARAPLVFSDECTQLVPRSLQKLDGYPLKARVGGLGQVLLEITDVLTLDQGGSPGSRFEGVGAFEKGRVVRRLQLRVSKNSFGAVLSRVINAGRIERPRHGRRLGRFTRGNSLGGRHPPQAVQLEVMSCASFSVSRMDPSPATSSGSGPPSAG